MTPPGDPGPGPSTERFATDPSWDAAEGWREVGRGSDPNDDLFGHVVTAVTPKTAESVDVVLVGEPYDGAVIGREGAAAGPTAIRRSLARTKTYHGIAGEVGSKIDIGDAGDVKALLDVRDAESTAPVERIQRRLLDTTADVHALDTLPVFLGGDNSLSYPNVLPLCESGSTGVINFDAHLDVRVVDENPTSGTPYRQLLDDGLDAYACVGARHHETSKSYHEYVEDCGGAVVTADRVGEDPERALRAAIDAMGDVEQVYVSVDCDVLDASAAPGVSAPTPGGIATRELFGMLFELGRSERLAGFEVVECAPPLDRDGLTTTAAGRAIAHLLAGYAEAR